MVVEDERIIALATCRMVTCMGHEVCACAHSGEAALRELERCAPDLVLMDIMLDGDLDGIDTVAIMQRDADVPVVYVTAYTDDKTRRKAEGTRYLDFVSKPLDEGRLGTILERLVRG